MRFDQLNVAIAILPLILGSLSGVLSGIDRQWYKGVSKPSWTPPAYLFGPVWTILYLLMGFASIPVIRSKQKLAIWVYIASLMLNVAWSPVFFKLKRPDLALIIIILLLALIIWMTILFSYITWRWVLLVPYVIWVSFASALNYAIFQRA